MDIESLKAAYAAMDVNKDGKVSRAELKACLIAVGHIFQSVSDFPGDVPRELSEEEREERLEASSKVFWVRGWGWFHPGFRTVVPVHTVVSPPPHVLALEGFFFADADDDGFLALEEIITVERLK